MTVKDILCITVLLLSGCFNIYLNKKDVVKMPLRKYIYHFFYGMTFFYLTIVIVMMGAYCKLNKIQEVIK